MRKRSLYFLILAMAACMLAMVIYAALNHPKNLNDYIQFRDSQYGLLLEPFYDTEEGKYYLFLPAYVTKEEVTVSPAPYSVSQFTFSCGNENTSARLAQMPLSEDITVTAKNPLSSQTFTIQLRQCENLPTLYVQANGDLLEYLRQDKAGERDIGVHILGENGDTLLQNMCTMNGRGNGTWDNHAKLPYTLTFSEPVSVGPFEEVTKLCLLAEFFDESKLHNALAYFGGQEMGIPYASPYMYINVYVNGKYLGLYGIVTKEEYIKHIEKDNIQAVFEISSGENRQEFWSASMYRRIHVMYGDLETVRAAVDSFEAALIDQDWARCRQKADFASFAQKYVLEEFFANYDMGYASQYFYLDQDGVIRCMLPWDYDWTLGSSVSYYNNKQSFELKVFRYESWYSLLLNDPQYMAQVTDSIDAFITDEFLQSLEDHLSECIRLIEASRDCDILRWKNTPMRNEFRIRSGMKSLSEFSTQLSSYFPARKTFMADYFRRPEEYCRIGFVRSFYSTYFIPKGDDFWSHFEGASILTCIDSQGRPAQWRSETDGATPEEIGIVTEDLVFRSPPSDQDDADVPSPSFFDKLRTYAGELAIIGCFGITALILFVIEIRRLGRKNAVPR